MLQVNEFTQSAVICFIVKNNQILLIEKLRGLGKGKINGPGGKLEAGETFMEAAIRETKEEILVQALDLQRFAQLGFRFSDGYSLYVEAFLASDLIGVPGASDEAIPHWYPITGIPYHRMWADDILWLPHLLQKRPAQGLFDFDGDTMLQSQVSLTPTIFAQ